MEQHAVGVIGAKDVTSSVVDNDARIREVHSSKHIGNGIALLEAAKMTRAFCRRAGRAQEAYPQFEQAHRESVVGKGEDD